MSITKITLPAEMARELAYNDVGDSADGLTVVSNEYVDSGRWHSYHLLVIADLDGSLYGATYERGLTEMQYTEPWEHERFVTFDPYVARTVEVTEYIPAAKASAEISSASIRYFRKKPIEVEAVQWTGDNEAELIAFTGGNFQAIDPEDCGDDPDATGQVYDRLHSTWVLAYPGQWVVKGVKGEFYPIAEDVLAETYEPVEVAP